MNNKTAYNPLKRAAAAAWAELSTPEACQWYGDRAWTDTFTTWAALSHLCQATIHLGMFCRVIVEDWLSRKSTEQQRPVALLPATLDPINDPEPTQPGTATAEADAGEVTLVDFIGLHDLVQTELPTADLEEMGGDEETQQPETEGIGSVVIAEVSIPQSRASKTSTRKPRTSLSKSSGTARK
jgi:hypothetical protein